MRKLVINFISLFVLSRVVADVESPGGKSGNVQTRGKAMANYS